MKKISTLMLAACLFAFLPSCESENSEESTDSDVTEYTETTPSETEATIDNTIVEDPETVGNGKPSMTNGDEVGNGKPSMKDDGEVGNDKPSMK